MAKTFNTLGSIREVVLSDLINVRKDLPDIKLFKQTERDHYSNYTVYPCYKANGKSRKMGFVGNITDGENKLPVYSMKLGNDFYYCILTGLFTGKLNAYIVLMPPKYASGYNFVPKNAMNT